MKIIIFGLGSIGKRHARILRDNFDCTLYAFRSKGKKNDLGIREVYDWKTVRKIKPDAAFITNPTNLHIPTAIKCARSGMDLFIEKPLSTGLAGIGALDGIARSKHIKTYVAYCLRFHPVIKWLKGNLDFEKVLHVRIVSTSFLPGWRAAPGKECYSASKKTGGGAILELSHEIDYLAYLFGDIISVTGAKGRLSDVTADAEDFADLLIRTKGACCNMHLNLFGREAKREISVYLEDCSINGDLINNTVTITTPNGVRKVSLGGTRDEMLLEQSKYFFESKKPMNSLAEARKIFAWVLNCKNKTKTYGHTGRNSS